MPSISKPDAIALLRLVVNAITETIDDAGPQGAPAGAVYAALMAHGMSYDGFQQLTAAMCEMGRISRRGDLFFSGEVSTIRII